MVNSSDIEFLEYVKNTHGIEMSLEDLRSLRAYLFEVSRSKKRSLPPVDVQNAPVAVAVVGGALGGFLAPALGVSTIAGILIGATIFSKLFNLFTRPKQRQEEEPERAFGFDSVTNLVPITGAIPLIWCNREKNLNGGVRASGFLIHAKVETFQGSQRYYGLQAFGYGQIGSFNEPELLLSDQPLVNFFAGDVQQFVRLGASEQTAIAEFPDYSQAISPNSNLFVGVDLRGEVESSVSTVRETAITASSTGTVVNGYLSTVNPTTFTTNTGTIAYVISDQQILQGDGWVSGQTLSSNHNDYIGFWVGGSYRFYIHARTDNKYEIIEDGVVVYVSTGQYALNDVFRVEYQSGTIIYRRNGSTFYTSTASPAYPVALRAEIHSNSSGSSLSIYDLRLADVVVDNFGNVEPVIGSTEITVNEDDEEKFTPSDRYRVNGVDFSIISKNENVLTVDVPLSLSSGDRIYATYTTKYETTQKCSEVHFNQVFQLWGRDEEGKLKKHAVCFDVYFRQFQSPTWIRLHRMYASNRGQGEIRRGFKVKNLPYDKYQFEFRPLEQVSGGFPILKMGDGGALISTPTGVFLGASQIIVETEYAKPPTESGANNNLSFDDKEQVSSEQSPPGRTTTINEVTLPSALGHPQVSRYPKLSLLGLKAIASERLQQTPIPSALIQSGRLSWLMVAAGMAAPASTGVQLVAFGEDLTIATSIGDTLRNLDKKTEGIITAITSSSLNTTEDLQWESGDRYLVYNIGSTCYFPDVLLDTVRSRDGGLGEEVDADQAIDYYSFVNSKRFCIQNNFYWDGVLTQATNLIEWAEQQASFSLLFSSSIDGRMALIPEQYSPPQATFTDSLMLEYNETLLNINQYNQVSVKYRDGSDTRFEEKSVTIVTDSAYNGLEPIYEAPGIDASSSVTTPLQAARIGQVFLQGIRFQDRGIGFSTGLQGMGISPGGLISASSVVTEIYLERSGFVVAVQPYDGLTQSQVVKLSQPVDDGFDSSYSASVYRIDGSENQDGLAIAAVNIGDEIWLHISGLDAAISPPTENRTGDYLAIAKDSTQRRQFRIAGIDIQSEYSCRVSATRWDARILTDEGLVTIY